MKQLVEYELGDGSTILVEVDLPEAGLERAGRGDQIVKAKERFADVLEQIKPVAHTVFSKLGDLSADEIGVAFGIKLGAKAGVVIASADTEANFTVSLTWKREHAASSSQVQTPASHAALDSE
jgi:Trypsin-co-occurring domain 1